MNYRTVHDGTKVTAIVDDFNGSVTASSQKFIIGTIEECVRILSNDGIDISLFWKDGHINRIVPIVSEVDISDKPNSSIKRKVFVYSMPINQVDKYLRFNLIVRHFDVNGNHVPQTQDDIFFTTLVNNDIEIDGVGEWDYFSQLVQAGVGLFDIQRDQIGVLDGNGRFDTIYP